VYRGVDATIACLESIAAARSSWSHDVVVIIDDSDRDRYTRVVDVAKRHAFFVLFNDENEGFPKTVNRGMRRHADRDVILLNSDTLVYGDWLDRLRRAAYQDKSIGTVTPFSNNATICSYPKIWHNNEVSAGEAKVVDICCASANAGRIADLPTGVGFCMYIRRNCILDVGLFDESLWGKGYGEENHFCLLAASRGWRNVLAADTFVAHVGHVSFENDQRETLMEANATKLSSLHPGYERTVAEFSTADPLRPLRERVNFERLRQTVEGCILFVASDIAGGVGRHLYEMAKTLTRQGAPVLVLAVTATGNDVNIRTAEGDSVRTYLLDSEFEDLRRDMARLHIRHLHYQHLMNLPDKILALAQDLQVSYDCTIHDYSYICPRATLVDDSGRYCGEPEVAVCERCVALSGPHPMWKTFGRQYGTVGALRSASSGLLSGARSVFCPNEDSKTRIRRYFSLDNLIVKPHLDPTPRFDPIARLEDGSVLRVAVIGAIGPPKGYDVLLACARYVFKTGIGIRFVVIGHTSNDEELGAVEVVSITGEYAEEEVFTLLREAHADIAFFPSVCPETYSYTLSIAFRAGLYPVAFDLGAIAQRIRSASYGKLIPPAAGPAEIVQALLAAAREAALQTPPRVPGMEYADLLTDYYELEKVRALAAGSEP
jgi:GT2 family glycosyltransferase/glycosyltransferase involved in cell wall biosynthesis